MWQMFNWLAQDDEKLVQEVFMYLSLHSKLLRFEKLEKIIFQNGIEYTMHNTFGTRTDFEP